jgi:hypothetical protein
MDLDRKIGGTLQWAVVAISGGGLFRECRLLAQLGHAAVVAVCPLL